MNDFAVANHVLHHTLAPATTSRPHSIRYNFLPSPPFRPNSNDYAANHVLHHTTGDASDYGQQLRAFREVTCCQVSG